eukprot:gene2942-4952_t
MSHVDLKMKLMKNGTFVVLGSKYIDDESMMEYIQSTLRQPIQLSLQRRKFN